MPEIYGYILDKDNDIDEKVRIFQELNISEDNIFCDSYAKQNKSRNAYDQLLERLEEGDVIYMHSLSDFGYDYERVVRDWNYIVKERKADISIIDMPLIDTRKRKEELGTYLCDVMVAMFGYMAEDRNKRKKVQMAGIHKALKNGIRFGRPAKGLPENYEEVTKRYLSGEISQAEAVRLLGMPRSTFRYQIEKMKKDNQQLK